MGELALRKILAGKEAIPGTAVLADRKVYGTFEPKRDQARRWAMEERGVLVSNFRGNAKLVDATWVYKSDVMFEDFPYWLDIFNAGGVTPLGGAGVGYTYDYTPAIAPTSGSDGGSPNNLHDNPLGSRTFEWGDETLQWQFPYSQGDALKIEMGTDDPIMMELNGFSQESWPVGRNGFDKGGAGRESGTAFAASIGDHAVEAPNGWQIRLFVDKFDPFDVSHNPIATTYIPIRYVKATAEYKNQNKRKYFGDFAPFYQKIGRGRREVALALTLEEDLSPLENGGVYDSTHLFEIGDMIDTNQPNFRVPQSRVRLQAVGSQIDATTFGTLQAIGKTSTTVADLAGVKLHSGGAITTAAIDPATFEVPSGASVRITIGAGPTFDTLVLSAPLHVGGTSISFASIVPAIGDWLDEARIYIVPPYTWLSVSAGLTVDFPVDDGLALVLGDHGQIVTVKPFDVDAGDFTVAIVPFVPRTDVPDASVIFRAKSIEFDFYGALEGDIKWAAHETNVAYDLSLTGVFDTDAKRQDSIKVTNGNANIG
jgi:hypothetical protein